MMADKKYQEAARTLTSKLFPALSILLSEAREHDVLQVEIDKYMNLLGSTLQLSLELIELATGVAEAASGMSIDGMEDKSTLCVLPKGLSVAHIRKSREVVDNMATAMRYYGVLPNA